MKKFLLYFLAAVASFALGLTAGTVINRGESTTQAKQEKPVKEEVEVSAPKSILKDSNEEKVIQNNADDEKYLLSLSDNSISVYRVLESGKTEFLYRKTVDAAALREEDYKSLCSGIMVYSEQEALEVLEDYVS